MKRSLAISVLFLCLLASGASATAAEEQSAAITLHPRSRVEEPAQSGKFEIVYKTTQRQPRQTAVIICDMWARHWCNGACDRGAQMAPRINEFVKAARKLGVLIIHAPSGGMQFYAEHPARKRAQAAPKAADLPAGIDGWSGQLDAEKKSTWPIDQADGGCDDQPQCSQKAPMDLHQTAAIEICEEDAISDSGSECWNLFAERGISNVVLVGVHTNMCVIGRPFGLRNMVRCGKNVLLVRDLTDTMYNSRCRPQVSHVQGTDLIVEHIEKCVCPTITSSDLLGGPAVRFKEDRRPHVVFIVSDDHYRADKLLPLFGQMLMDRYGCYATVAHGQGTANFSGLEELQAADCAVLLIRRMAPPKGQLDMVRSYLGAGKPLVALRTASHAFSINGQGPPGADQWPEFDKEVLGGSYHGHGPEGSDISLVPAAAGHPILAGIQPAEWHSSGSLYFAAPIDPKATLLMTGASQGKTEPVAWTRSHNGGRVFYSSLGHWDDYATPQFQTMLVNAIFWAMDRPVPQARQ